MGGPGGGNGEAFPVVNRENSTAYIGVLPNNPVLTYPLKCFWRCLKNNKGDFKPRWKILCKKLLIIEVLDFVPDRNRYFKAAVPFD